MKEKKEKQLVSKTKKGYFYIESDVHIKMKAYCALAQKRYVDVATQIFRDFLETKEAKRFFEP